MTESKGHVSRPDWLQARLWLDYSAISAQTHCGIGELVQEVNLETGYVCGSMRAENVPQAKTPVVTFWEGDIIDNVNHSFITSKWGADKKIDVKHWPRFAGFEPLRRQVQAAGGRSGRLNLCPPRTFAVRSPSHLCCAIDFLCRCC